MAPEANQEWVSPRHIEEAQRLEWRDLFDQAADKLGSSAAASLLADARSQNNPQLVRDKLSQSPRQIGR